MVKCPLSVQTLRFLPGLCLRCPAFTASRGVSTSQTLNKKLDKSFKTRTSKWSRVSNFNFDTAGSWNTRLEMPINIEQSIKSGKLIPDVDMDNIGSVSLVGRRKDNEDRICISEISPNLLMFAIFDGHGGAHAVDFAVQYMEKYIVYYLERGETDLQAVLTTAFVEVNNSFARHASHLGDKQVTRSGTAATVCLLQNGNHLVVAHVGDCSALLCRNGEVRRLTRDHKPDVPSEKKRIRSSGGFITSTSVGKDRVNARLDMSRSIGDLDLKSAGVIATPETKSLEVKHGEDAFLALSTDGVSCVMPDQEVINVAARCDNATEAAQFVADCALQFGSEDNVSAIIVPFGSWGKFANTTHTVAFSFCRGGGSRYG